MKKVSTKCSFGIASVVNDSHSDEGKKAIFVKSYDGQGFLQYTADLEVCLQLNAIKISKLLEEIKDLSVASKLFPVLVTTTTTIEQLNQSNFDHLIVLQQRKNALSKLTDEDISALGIEQIAKKAKEV